MRQNRFRTKTPQGKGEIVHNDKRSIHQKHHSKCVSNRASKHIKWKYRCEKRGKSIIIIGDFNVPLPGTIELVEKTSKNIEDLPMLLTNLT